MKTDCCANIIKNRMVSRLRYNLENIIQEKATTSITVKVLMEKKIETKAARNSTFPVQVFIALLRTSKFRQLILKVN